MQTQLETADPPKRSWWSPAPVRELIPVSRRRAYVEVLFVYSAFFLVSVVAAGLLLAGRTNDVQSNGSWGIYIPLSISVIFETALAVVVVMLLCERRGVTRSDLGLKLPRRDDGHVAAGQLTRIVAWAMFAIIVGAVLNGLLQDGHHLPNTQDNAPQLIFSFFDSINAGIVEELVVLALVVVTLRQARRPLWEITLVVLLLRGSYHIYYGAGVVGILVWAALYYWIYLRFQSVVPLMICHGAWDAVEFFGQRWPGVIAVGIVVVIGIWIAAPITWAVERADRKARGSRATVQSLGTMSEGFSPAASVPTPLVDASVPVLQTRWPLAQPGWHPDPSGLNQWRWWDGYRWTEHVSTHTSSSST